jgi:hypothetical protein
MPGPALLAWSQSHLHQGTSPGPRNLGSGMRSIRVMGSWPRPQIEPITEQIPDQIPLGEAQRLDGEAYESPALPLSHPAAAGILPQADVRSDLGSYGRRRFTRRAERGRVAAERPDPRSPCTGQPCDSRDVRRSGSVAGLEDRDIAARGGAVDRESCGHGCPVAAPARRGDRGDVVDADSPSGSHAEAGRYRLAIRVSNVDGDAGTTGRGRGHDARRMNSGISNPAAAGRM